MSATVVWEGADVLREFLVPVADLERHPRNPRRGDVPEIVKSLQRYGQVRPVLVDAESRIIAGNHTYLAARELGWSHVAAIPNTFADENEARAYLLADNRLPELGDYDQEELRALLEEIEQAGSWEGSGYTADDLEDLRAAQNAVAETEPAPFAGDYALTEDQLAERQARLAGGQAMHELVLLFDAAQDGQFEVDQRVLAKEYGMSGMTEIIVRAVRDAALRRNQGAA